MKLSHTEQEMLEAKRICENFDFDITKVIAERIGNKRIIITGMGSSLMFPGKNAKSRALSLNISNQVEAYLSSDLFQYKDFSNTVIFICSNSGKTKETVLFSDYASSLGGECIAVTAVKDSILAQKSTDKIILSGGFEKGVAATKSVIEQALIYDSIVFHLAKNQGKVVDFELLKRELSETATSLEQNINLILDDDLLKILTGVEQYYFVGLDNGVAEEMTLKCYEIVRRQAFFFPDTHITHGVVEAINGGCAVIFGPEDFKDYISDFEKFKATTGCGLVGVGDTNLISGVDVKVNETFKNYCLLSAGWGILRNIANSLKIDVDHPERATKVGNPYEETSRGGQN